MSHYTALSLQKPYYRMALSVGQVQSAMEAYRNFKFEGNIPFTHVTNVPIWGQKGRRLRSHGTDELSNWRCITQSAAEMMTVG